MNSPRVTPMPRIAAPAAVTGASDSARVVGRNSWTHGGDDGANRGGDYLIGC
jgi:hypothetical protein